MKHFTKFIPYLFLLLTLSTLQGSAFATPLALHVYAGAGLRPALDKLASRFEMKEGVNIRIDYGGSGQILSRFQASHRGDLFIPGSKVHFSTLEKSGDLLSVQDIVMHTPVLAIFPDKKNQIKTFSDLAKSGVRLGVGDPKSMALGRTAEKILQHSQMEAAIRKNIVVQAATVKQLAMYVLRGDVDAAIIGRSDVIQNSDKLTMLAIPSEWYEPEVIAVGVLKTAEQHDLANRFATFLVSKEGIDTFIELGFLPCDKALN
jgi:molybdate transport system substrate-binding protein